MTTGLFALESRLPQQQTNCSVGESQLLDGPHSLLVAWEFLLVHVLCCWQVQNNRVDLRCWEKTIIRNSWDFQLTKFEIVGLDCMK